jgi:hypothetical protein
VFLEHEVEMKTYSTVVAALLICAPLALSAPLVAGAQSGTGAGSDLASAETPFILAELTDSLNAKKLKPGDRVKAQVAQDVLAHGRIVIPAESKLLGHITEATPRDTENGESRLGIVFDKVVLKHHEEMNFQGVVHAVSPPVPRKSRIDEPSGMAPPPVPGSSSPGIAPLGNTKPNNQNTTNPPSRASTTDGSSTPMIQGPPNSPRGLPDSPDSSNSQANTTGANQSLSVGMRQGVFGLKGLSLSTVTGGPTPGPVIVSKVSDVKLEYGTQVLLRVVDTPATRQ